MVFSSETNLIVLITCIILLIIDILFGLWFWISQIISLFKPEWTYNYWGIRLLITFIIGCILVISIVYLSAVLFVTSVNTTVKTIPETDTNTNKTVPETVTNNNNNI